MTRIAYDLTTLVARYLAHCFRTQSPPRVDELAQWAGVSRITLTKQFKRELGEVPSEHLKEAQLARAAELLSTGEHLTRDIAYDAAFGTRRSFFRAIRRETGRTPRTLTANVKP